MKKTATYLLIGIFLHNIPEGMAIALGEASTNVSIYVIAIAIAIHNIPEGICTSAPYYHTTKKRLKAFLLSSSTAIPILVGFVIASILYQYISNQIIGLIVGATAGLMIYITSDEIIPTSCRKITDHTPANLVIPEIYPGSLEPLPQPDYNRIGFLLDERCYPAADTIPGVFFHDWSGMLSDCPTDIHGGIFHYSRGKFRFFQKNLSACSGCALWLGYPLVALRQSGGYEAAGHSIYRGYYDHAHGSHE